jgi:hypothetical protein
LFFNNLILIGEWAACTIPNTNILVVRWLDKKDCYFFTNVFDAEPVIQNGRRLVPRVDHEYNQYMFFVDKSDDFSGNLPHRSGSITGSIFKYLFQITVVNAFVYWKVKTNNKSLCFRSFREAIVLSFLKKRFAVSNKRMFSHDNHYILSGLTKRRVDVLSATHQLKSIAVVLKK